MSYRILLGVTGGIAAYKACELARLFIKAGAEVRVVMTAHAQEFVGALSFQAITGQPVRSALFDAAHEAAMGHIELARWPDAIVIAPASANTLARLAQGMADDLLSTLVLASNKPLFVAPAMNQQMWAHPATQANLATLSARGVRSLGPGNGVQACGDVGEGRLQEPADIAAVVLHALQGPQPLAGTHAVVTAGPTLEPIDPVRFISNHSSGKQGYALAAALRALGAQVTLISGPTALAAPAGVQRLAVQTAQQMLQASLAAAASAQLFVGAAAVADYSVQPAPHKLKKQGEALTLTLQQNPDILASVRQQQPQLFMVGFAAETQDLAQHAQAKLARKGLQMIAANWVGEGRAFGTEHNALEVFWPGPHAQAPVGHSSLPTASKPLLAAQLAQLIAQHYAAHANRTT